MAGKSSNQTFIQGAFNARLPLLRLLQNKVFKNYIELFNAVFVRFLVLGFNFLAATLITRALSVEDRGKYAILINLVVLCVTFFSFGFHSSIIYRLSNSLKLFLPLYIISFAISVFSIAIIAIILFFGNFIHCFSEIDYWDNIILICGGPIALFSYFNANFIYEFQEKN